MASKTLLPYTAVSFPVVSDDGSATVRRGMLRFKHVISLRLWRRYSQCGRLRPCPCDYFCRKDWTQARFRCITIDRRSETPLAKFEECLQRLEKIVQELEKGEVPLEKSLALFEEGMQLSSTCRKELEQAEGKVEILLKKNGKLQAEPFEPLTEKAPARR